MYTYCRPTIVLRMYRFTIIYQFSLAFGFYCFFDTKCTFIIGLLNYRLIAYVNFTLLIAYISIVTV